METRRCTTSSGQGNIDTAKVLIEAGANLQLASHDGETHLQFARSHRRPEIAALIERKLAGG